MSVNGRKYRWFVYTRGDANTNEIVSAGLPGETTSLVLCSDGERRHLWTCTHAFITELWKSKKQFGLTFDVYVKEGGWGSSLGSEKRDGEKIPPH
jgi:hypothetical protein